MEIIDYKEKYEQALEVAQRFYNNSVTITKKGLEDIFPELKESEDERVLKIIKETLKSYYSGIIFGSLSARDYADCLAWLEKQDKKKSIDDLTQQEAMDIAFAKCFEWDAQKPTDNVEPKFKVGDIIKPKCYNETHSIKAIGERYYILDVDIKIPFRDEDDWELVEQNPAWSEEDETMLKRVIDFIPQCMTAHGYNEHINWLKSLKERCNWKPSDEQMDALHYVTNFDYGGHKTTLASLYEQLKKLKG